MAASNMTPAGSGSTMVTCWASDGPRFVAVTVQVIVLPATVAAGPSLERETSALSVTSAVVVAVSLAGLGSGVEEETLAVFVSGPAGTKGGRRPPLRWWP